jgi:hypothetical protein
MKNGIHFSRTSRREKYPSEHAHALSEHLVFTAKREGWLGEVEGLQVSHAGAQDELAQIDAALHRQADAVQLDIPTFPQVTGCAIIDQPSVPCSNEDRSQVKDK